MTEQQPVLCDMTAAHDTVPERMAEYQRLFATALTGLDRADGRVRFRFRPDDAVEGWVRDLGAREQACCAFFRIRVERTAREVWWETAVDDDPVARAVLAEFASLAAQGGTQAEAVSDRARAQGLRILEPAPSPGPARERRR